MRQTSAAAGRSGPLGCIAVHCTPSKYHTKGGLFYYRACRVVDGLATKQQQTKLHNKVLARAMPGCLVLAYVQKYV